jgi:agmatinase
MKILNTTPPYNLFGLEEQNYKTSKVVAIPIPYDSTVTYKSGARDGPRAIIEASRNMELYSEEFNGDISKAGIYTTEELAPDFSSPEKTVERIEKEVGLVLDDGKLPLLIGGEHTVALGSIKALASRNKKFTVIHFDAHSDSRDELFGTKYCHACVAARARELADSCYSVGVRSIDEQSAKKYPDSILYMKDMQNMSTQDIINAIRVNTLKDIYITVDLDVLDPSEMPSVGTPEPNGLTYSKLKDILRGSMMAKDVLGIDFTELSPIPGLIAPNYLAAKLIYSAIGSIWSSQPKSSIV